MALSDLTLFTDARWPDQVKYCERKCEMKSSCFLDCIKKLGISSSCLKCWDKQQKCAKKECGLDTEKARKGEFKMTLGDSCVVDKCSKEFERCSLSGGKGSEDYASGRGLEVLGDLLAEESLSAEDLEDLFTSVLWNKNRV